MELRNLVRINDEGLVADSVNFDMMEDAEKNLTLCKGFVFNFDSRRPKDSTVGVLECVRDSFFSRTKPNVHLVVQDYGKGKSHFALVMANFFQKPADSKELAGILHQIGLATAGSSSLAEDLRAYKQRSLPHLVIRISGDKETDLRQMFLRAVRRALDGDGITDTIAQHLCDRPLEYLEGLTIEQRAKADRFLSDHSTRFGNLDIEALIRLLRNQDYRSVATVVEVSRELTNGFAINFDSDVSIEEIIDNLVNRLCVGEGRRYEGILILFDELYAYLHDSWVPNPARAGGMALQNITNACENHKPYLALVCFTQVRPLAVQPADSTSVRLYQKLATRLELAPSTYEPMSSLELVLDALIITQSEDKWGAFKKEWGRTLGTESERAYERYITLYKERNWPYQEFCRHLSLGCFPLHPMTSYFLCNLDFTQGRTAVQFIKEDVKRFIRAEPADVGGFPNYIYAVQLVDAFASNLSNHPAASDYLRAITAVTASADADDVIVLKALFLFYVGGAKLKKPDSEPHEDLLSFLTGLSADRVKHCLSRLTTELGVIYHVPRNNTYRFYAGLGLADLKKAIETETAGVNPTIDLVARYCQGNLAQIVGDVYIEGARFVTDHRLNGADWMFEVRLYSGSAIRDLLAAGAVETKTRGVLAYVLPATSEEAASLRNEMSDLLSGSAINNRVIVALPSGGLADVARTLLLLSTLRGKGAAEREKYGEAFSQLQKLWQQDVDRRLGEAFRDCEFCHPILKSLPVVDRDDRQQIVSALLERRFPLTPSVESIDKLRANHKTGSEIISYMVKQLFGGTLSKQNLPNKAYATIIDNVFVQRWGILSTSGPRYAVQPPRDRRVETAWKRISEICDLAGESEKFLPLGQLWRDLASEPYGYNELTFLALLGAWLTYHSREIRLAIRKKTDRETLMIEASLSRFVAPDSQFDKTFGKPKDFLTFFTASDAAFLIRREPVTDVIVPQQLTVDEVAPLIGRIEEYLGQDGVDKAKAAELTRKKAQLVDGADAIVSWIGSIRNAVAPPLPSSISELALRYSAVGAEAPDTSEGVAVVPTEAQRNEQFQAIETLRTAVKTVLDARRTSASLLASDAECSAFLAQLDRDREACQHVPTLDGAFEATFQDVQLSAQRRREQLVRDQRLREGVATIQRVLGSLNANSGEALVERARKDLEEIAEAVPGVRATEEFQRAVARLNECASSLATTLAEWPKRAKEIAVSRDAERLREEILARQERYDSSQSESIVKELLIDLDRIAATLRESEESERAARHCLHVAEAFAGQIPGVSHLPSCLKLYDDLRQAVLGLPGGASARLRSEAERIDAAARSAIVKKAEMLCTTLPGSVPEVDRLQRLLSELHTLVSSRPEFAAVAGMVERGLSALAEARTNLAARDDDRRAIEAVRRIRPDTAHSVASCRQKLAELADLQARVHNAAGAADDISRVRTALESKIASFAAQLDQIRQRLETATSAAKLSEVQRSYNQLDLVFRGSEMEPEYAALDVAFAAVAEDFAVLAELQAAARNAHSVVTCRAVIELAERQRIQLHTGERFSGAVATIVNAMTEKLANYGRDLEQRRAALAGTDNKRDAEKIWEAIVASASQFAGSELDGAYNELRDEAELVVSLLRTCKPAAQLHAPEDCESALAALERWRAEVPIINDGVLARLTSYQTSIQTKLTDLALVQRRKAEAWVRELSEAAETLSNRPDTSDRAQAAAKVLSRITDGNTAHLRWLSEPAENELQAIEQRCRQLVDSDREAQVFALLGQLPLDKQAAICRKLAATLHWEVTVVEVAATGD